MSNIADECGLQKGSIYHYFKSKEEIALESLKYIHTYFKDNIFNISYQETLTNKEKLKLFVKKIDTYFLNSKGGCLLGNLALEVSLGNILFQNEIKEYFINWEKALSNILEESYSKREALNLSKEFIALTQGEIMMMNLYNSKDNYIKVGKKLIALIE